MHTSKGKHGGGRKGAGRPLGSRNKPHLIANLPVTQCPRVWLLALLNHEAAPIRLRLKAAVILLPYQIGRAGG